MLYRVTGLSAETPTRNWAKRSRVDRGLHRSVRSPSSPARHQAHRCSRSSWMRPRAVRRPTTTITALFDKSGNPVFGKDDFDGDGKPDQLTGTYGANKNFGPTARTTTSTRSRVVSAMSSSTPSTTAYRSTKIFISRASDQPGYSFFDDFGGYSSGLVKESNRALGVDTYVKLARHRSGASHCSRRRRLRSPALHLAPGHRLHPGGRRLPSSATLRST